jgi:hypothetical protein
LLNQGKQQNGGIQQNGEEHERTNPAPSR